MRDARPSLFIFAVLSAVLRSGFRDTGQGDPNPFAELYQCDTFRKHVAPRVFSGLRAVPTRHVNVKNELEF